MSTDKSTLQWSFHLDLSISWRCFSFDVVILYNNQILRIKNVVFMPVYSSHLFLLFWPVFFSILRRIIKRSMINVFTIILAQVFHLYFFFWLYSVRRFSFVVFMEVQHRLRINKSSLDRLIEAIQDLQIIWLNSIDFSGLSEWQRLVVLLHEDDE